jgi:hypothetical protein
MKEQLGDKVVDTSVELLEALGDQFVDNSLLSRKAQLNVR